MEYDKVNDYVAFKEDTHLYFNLKDPNIKYVSVTTLIGKYHEEFDGEFWSSYKAIEKLISKEEFQLVKKTLLTNKRIPKNLTSDLEIDNDLFLKTKKEILESYEKANKEACERGTCIHKDKELQFYESEYINIEKLTGLNGKFHCRKDDFNLSKEQAVYPEFLIYYHHHKGFLNIAGQVDLLVKDGNDIYIYDWKGLPLETPIATEFGWKKLKDLTKNDRIFDKDGKLTNIINISEIHNNPCYKIKFDNSESIVADHEHRWLISFRNLDGSYRDKIMTTEEIKIFIDSNKRTSYNIPKIINAKPLELPNVELPIDPYVLGGWLGDGSKSCGIITNVNQNFWNEVKKRGYEISKNLNENHAEMRTVYGISPKLRKLNLINNKHIPDMYLRSSYSQRLDLLRGFMDTDGYYNEKRKRFVMSTGQRWQADDTAKLVSSLGWKPTILPYKKKCNGKEFQCWDVCFYATENPFLIRNQDIKIDMKHDNNSYRVIKSIELVETIETKCLEVDSPSHTFLAGYTLIPTHNTNSKGIESKAYFNQATRQTKKMFHPISNIEDTTLMHYTLQLSLYAFMLQELHPEFNIKVLKLVHISPEGKETEIELEYKKEEVKKLIEFHAKKCKKEYEVNKINFDFLDGEW